MSTALIAVSVAGPAAAQIVPDGATATSVTTGARGQPVVSIAPTFSNGVSYNGYSAFSVGGAGADLDNRSVRANTIVNEVTSSSRSVIEGPVEVLGSRAHVVLANPNGITVDGGSFVNTGSVILSGGRIVDPTAAHPVITSGSGDILVGPGGLGGTMTTLQLLAAKIRVDGPIVNDHISPDAEIHLLAGNAEVTVDPAVSANSTLTPYVTDRRHLGGSSGEVLVDVTPRGFMSSSRVKIEVSAKGAGVNFNGAGMATAGDFSISASGKISATGAVIRAETSVKLAGGSVEILNSPEHIATLSANSGPVTVLADKGDIFVTGQVIGARRDGSDADSKGAVTLSAAGDITLLSENSDRLAIVYGADDTLYMQAGGSIVNNSGRMLANGAIELTAGGALRNVMDVDGGETQGAPQRRVVKKSFWLSWLFGKKKRIITTFDYGRLRLPDERALIFGSSVVIDADEVVNTGEISAADGSLAITARAVRNLGVASGSAYLKRTCDIFCRNTGGGSIEVSGGVMNAQYALSIDASEIVENRGGRMIAYGNLDINAPRIVNEAMFVPVVVRRPASIGHFWSGSDAWIGYQPVGGYILAPIGTVTLNTDTPVVNDGGWIEGEADTVSSSGIIEVRPAQPVGPPGGNPIGVFEDLIP
jgi:filamentous hemagglutinin family protein